MTDFQTWLNAFYSRISADAAQALDQEPRDQDAGVLVTPVVHIGDRVVELEPMPFYRPAEGPHRG